MTENSSLLPGHGSTLVEVLRSRAQKHPDRPVYTYVADVDRTPELTFAQLDLRARAIAAALQGVSEPGDRAVLLHPHGLDYVAAFFGCVYAGVVAAPAFPPKPNRTTSRLDGIVADATPRLALTTASALAALEQRGVEAPAADELTWVATDKVEDAAAARWCEPELDADSLAYLQYTSGSTRAPRGVMVSHRNLLHNVVQIEQALGLGDEQVIVSWLPLYHDMGLIGKVILPVYLGTRSVLMSPLTFLQRPVRWLEAISRYRGTISAAPNFAYELCVQKVKPEEREQLDLGSWTCAINAAEPVRPETLQRFADAFAVSGFRREALTPCFGLAEATLFVSGRHGATGPGLLTVSREALAKSTVAESRSDASDAVRVVSCGAPSEGLEVEIVDPHTHVRCAPGHVGEIWVKGESIGDGYWRRLEESDHTFRARIAHTGDGPFMRTGDLGFIRDGELYVAGRLKDLIVIDGRNHYPQDIELTVETCHHALRPNASAAFALVVGGEERLVVAAELDRSYYRGANGNGNGNGNGGPDLKAVKQAVRRAIAEHHDIDLHNVVFLRHGSIPKTSSNKIQRHACRARLLAGTLEQVA